MRRKKFRLFKPLPVADSTKLILDGIAKAYAEGGPNMMGYTLIGHDPFAPSDPAWIKTVVTKDAADFTLKSKAGLRNTSVIVPEYKGDEKTGMYEVWTRWGSKQ